MVTCSGDVLAANAAQTVDLVVVVASDAPPGQLLNRASVRSNTYDYDLSDNSTQIATAVAAQADLALFATSQPTSVTAGDVFNYGLRLDNRGPSTAHTIVLTDTLPDQVEYVRTDASGGVVCTYLAGPHIVQCLLSSLAPTDPSAPAVAQVIITARARSDAAAGEFANDADVASATADGVPTNNHAASTTTLAARARLLLDKQTDTPNPASMQVFKYLLTVHNTGSSTAKGVTVADTLPGEVEYIQATQGGCPTACALGDIAPGQTRTVEITVRLRSNVPSGVRVTNRGQVSSTTPLATDSVTSASVDVVTTAAADLKIRLYGEPDGLVGSGKWLTYTILVDNLGPGVARNVVVNSLLSSAAVYTFTAPSICAPGAGNGVTGDHPLLCTVGDLAAGAQQRFQLHVVANEPQSIRHSVDVVTSSFDPDYKQQSGDRFPRLRRCGRPERRQA